MRWHIPAALSAALALALYAALMYRDGAQEARQALARAQATQVAEVRQTRRVRAAVASAEASAVRAAETAASAPAAWANTELPQEVLDALRDFDAGADGADGVRVPASRGPAAPD